MRYLNLMIGVLLVVGCVTSQTSVPVGTPPPDRPVTRQDERLAELVEWMQPCIRHARETFPEVKQRFVQGLGDGYELSVVMRIRDPETAQIEQVFVTVEAIQGPMIYGHIANDVMGVQGFVNGTAVWVVEDEILDWVIVDPAGKETGNFIGKYLDALQDGQVDGPCRPVA